MDTKEIINSIFNIDVNWTSFNVITITSNEESRTIWNVDLDSDTLPEVKSRIYEYARSLSEELKEDVYFKCEDLGLEDIIEYIG